MKNIFRATIILLTCIGFWSCYEGYVHDYPESSVCFALQNPLRTVIADRDMEIFVGVSIGGKREVNMADWAKFKIEPSLLVGTRFQLLPPSYYTLKSDDTFKVRKSNLPVADVGITFTDDFYNDPNSTTEYYALPLEITDHSLDVITTNKHYSIVVIKYVSTFHGTYYVRGQVEKLDGAGVVVAGSKVDYYQADLSKNLTRPLVTLSKYELRRNGIAEKPLDNGNKQMVGLTIQPTDDPDKKYNVIVGKGDNAAALDITDGSGTYYGKEKNPRLDLDYKYDLGGTIYHVKESLFLRRDVLEDLRVETWQ